MTRTIFGVAVVGFAFWMGWPLHHSHCCINRAKAESVMRAQRQQSWRYYFTRPWPAIVGAA
jgi:hypothetical protein